ncbi:MAG: hypothetical protein ABIZ95_13615 [Pyrinomonadaceae bacterium]
MLIFAVVFCSGLQMAFAQDNSGYALYLLPPSIRSADLAKLDIKKIKAAGKPLITTTDISSYVKDRHEMVIYDQAGLRLKKLVVPVGGRPFIVFAGGEPIFTGAFWTSLSSISFHGVVINVTDLKGDYPVLKLELDYPSTAANSTTADPRSDPRIMRILEKNSKLREEVWLYGKCKEVRPTQKRRQSFVFTFDVTSVVRSTYDPSQVVFENYDDKESSLRSAVQVAWPDRYGVEGLPCDSKKLILLKFQRLVSATPQPVYLESFEVKD